MYTAVSLGCTVGCVRTEVRGGSVIKLFTGGNFFYLSYVAIKCSFKRNRLFADLVARCAVIGEPAAR